jgi:hypothetical protein
VSNSEGTLFPVMSQKTSPKMDIDVSSQTVNTRQHIFRSIPISIENRTLIVSKHDCCCCWWCCCCYNSLRFLMPRSRQEQIKGSVSKENYDRQSKNRHLDIADVWNIDFKKVNPRYWTMDLGTYVQIPLLSTLELALQKVDS